MTDFETTLAEALRDEAREIAMSTDKNQATLELESRLDGADRAHRRYWAIGAAAVAAALVGIAVLVAHVGSGSAPQPPASHTPVPTGRSTTFTSNGFVLPLSLTVPGWFAAPEPLEEAARSVTWEQSDCALPDTACANGADLKLRIVAPVQVYRPQDTPMSVPMPDYAGYVAYLQTLKDSGVTVSDQAVTTVGGRPATLVSLTPTVPLFGAIGCEDKFEAAKDCWGFVKNTDEPAAFGLRMAVIDTGSTPLLVWLRFNQTNPDRADAIAQFDRMLGTIAFGPAATPSTT